MLEKIKVRPIMDFLLGVGLMWVVLVLHANTTLTQFWGLISDTRVALSASLILSVFLFIVYLIFIVFSVFIVKRPFMALGSLAAFPLVYASSRAVQQGFAIFFKFI